jgi:putative transposase
MKRYSSHFKVAKMCRTLETSRSGYYAFLSRGESDQEKRRHKMLSDITRIHQESHSIYGSPRITAKLHREGVRVSRGMVCRLMTKNGIRSRTARKYKATTDSNHNLPIAGNIVNRDFSATKRDIKWLSDITSIWTDEGWLYLAGILDVYDDSIVGWSMNKRMTRELVIKALKSACLLRKPDVGLLLHSDRGSQYCSEDYQKEISQRKFICSMSRKGNCWDNAPMESFWGKLKTEWLYGKRFRTRNEAQRAVFEYIELFYNRKRLHSRHGFIPPLQVGKIAVMVA